MVWYDRHLAGKRPWVIMAVLALWVRLSSAATDTGTVVMSSGRSSSTALLLALQDGPAGLRHLQEWGTYIQRTTEEFPQVWVVCRDNSPNIELVRSLAPNFQLFMVEDNATWETVLKNFLLQTTPAKVFGFLGEGVLPPVDLARSITSLEQALAGYLTPVAVVSRSKSKVAGNSRSEWLPDAFVAQVWCNSLMITELGLDGETVATSTLRGFLPKLVSAHQNISGGADALVLADGTHLVPSVYDTEGGGLRQDLSGDAPAADGEKLYIGALEHALLPTKNGDGETLENTVAIGTAPWPPVYVLEHVANDEGLVLVNSVNCGYLDFAINFFRSARKVNNDVKVLWVATDEVAFDFMDTAAPGCAAMFPAPKSKRHHAGQAGKWGDSEFKSQVVIRPQILLHILRQGYTLLWTDSDMVWLEDPIPFLPDPRDPKSAEIMLQLDGTKGNVCTCFLFMKPTSIVKLLLLKWIKAMVDLGAKKNQTAFQRPLSNAKYAGLRVAHFPQDHFPPGNKFFNHTYEDNYSHIYFPEISIVHNNNWISGHDRKKERFEAYHLWDAGDTVFPPCDS